MNIKKTIPLYLLCIFFFIFDVVQIFCQESLFTGVVPFLKDEYATPFQVAGRVREVTQNSILFKKSNEIKNIKVGQEFWACDNRSGISPHLQRQIAWIKVQAVFSQTVMASVEQVMARAVEPDDWVLTPASPIVHVYSNIESKHAFFPYQNLIKNLLDAGFQIKETDKDVIPEKSGENDLLLRLESDADHLVCRLIRGKEGKLLYYEAHQNSFLVPSTMTSGSTIKFGNTQPETLSGTNTLNTPAYEEKSDFYRLDKAYTKVICFDLEGDGITDIALLNDKGVSIYEFVGSSLSEKLNYTFTKKNLFPLNLQSMDINHDGKDELFVTLAKSAVIFDKEDSQLCSKILTFKGDSLEPLVTDWPYYLNVIFNKTGQQVALAQKKGKYTQYAGPVSQITWDTKSEQPKIAGPYQSAAGIYSIYQFNFLLDDPNRVVILEPSNDLHGYFIPEERVDASGPRNYGDFQETGYPIKLEKDQYLGGFLDKKTFKTIYAPRRFELNPRFDNQSFLIYKERPSTMIKKILNSNKGTDSVVGVKWSGNRLIETWQSKKFARELLDFTFLFNPKRIMVLCRDDDGYSLETLY